MWGGLTYIISINWSLMFAFLQLGVPTTVPKIATNLTALCTPIPMGGSRALMRSKARDGPFRPANCFLYIAAIPHLAHRRGGVTSSHYVTSPASLPRESDWCHLVACEFIECWRLTGYALV